MPPRRKKSFLTPGRLVSRYIIIFLGQQGNKPYRAKKNIFVPRLTNRKPETLFFLYKIYDVCFPKVSREDLFDFSALKESMISSEKFNSRYVF